MTLDMENQNGVAGRRWKNFEDMFIGFDKRDRQTDGQTDTARHKRMAFAVEDFRKKPHVKLDL